MTTKENIILQASSLFLKKGYKQTSLNEIAENVNITKGGIYHYFKDKHELFLEMVHYFKLTFENLFLEMENESSLENLLKNYFKHVEILELKLVEDLKLSNEDIKRYSQLQSRFFLDAQVYGPKDIDFQLYNVKGRRMYDILKKKVEEAKIGGEILKDLDVEETCIEAMAIFDGYIVLKRLSLIENAYYYGNRSIGRFWNRIKTE